MSLREEEEVLDCRVRWLRRSNKFPDKEKIEPSGNIGDGWRQARLHTKVVFI